MRTCPSLDVVKVILTLCLGVSATAAVAATPDREATLAAIHSLENPRNLTRPGPRGELGAYQFREGTWRTYTREPFLRALDRRISDRVAVQHYEWLKAQLERANQPVNTYNIALAWNGGVTAAITGRAPRVAHDYARRATNLANAFANKGTLANSR